MKQIALGHERFALVDDADYAELSRYRWRLHPRGYAQRSERVDGKTKDVLMHRALLQPGPCVQVDHINGDKLDNHRANLRLATPAQNQQNKPKSRGTSHFKGVSRTHDGRWKATIYVDHKPLHLGFHDDEEDAADAYNEAASLYFGGFAFQERKAA